MAWPWRTAVWGQYLQRAQRDIERLVIAIAAMEPVILLIPRDGTYAPLPSRFQGLPVELVRFQYDDSWVRDTTPLWLERGRAIDPRFNGWGRKDIPGKAGHPIPFAADADLALALCSAWGVEIQDTGLVMEGGAIESDGEGLLLSTASNLLHFQRNGWATPSQIQDLLSRTVDARLVLLPGSTHTDDVTDGHIDGLVRLGLGGTPILETIDPADSENPEHYDLELNSQRLEELLPGHSPFVINRPFDSRSPRRFHAYHGETFSYLNFYVCSGGIVMPSFGRGAEQSDRAAAAALAWAFRLPSEAVKAVPVDGITLYGGGGIHCVTREIPASLGLSFPELVALLRKFGDGQPGSVTLGASV